MKWCWNENERFFVKSALFATHPSWTAHQWKSLWFSKFPWKNRNMPPFLNKQNFTTNQPISKFFGPLESYVHTAFVQLKNMHVTCRHAHTNVACFLKLLCSVLFPWSFRLSPQHEPMMGMYGRAQISAASYGTKRVANEISAPSDF